MQPVRVVLAPGKLRAEVINAPYGTPNTVIEVSLAHQLSGEFTVSSLLASEAVVPLPDTTTVPQPNTHTAITTTSTTVTETQAVDELQKWVAENQPQGIGEWPQDLLPPPDVQHLEVTWEQFKDAINAKPDEWSQLLNIPEADLKATITE